MLCKQLNGKYQLRHLFIALVLICCCTCSVARNTDMATETHAASVTKHWDSQFHAMSVDIEDTQAKKRGSSPHILDRQALTFLDDKHPTGIVIRRTEALLEHMKSMEGDRDLTGLQTRLAEVKKRYNNTDKPDRALYMQACGIRRELVISNPVLDFDEMIFVTKSGSREGVLQCWDYGYAVNNGGGLYKVSGIKSGSPKITSILQDPIVKKGRMKGKRLTPNGAFNTPALSYDGKKIIFSYVEEVGHKRPWPLDTLECFTKERSFHLYSVNTDGSDLIQLTDGKRNDYHPCFLPNGRIVFVSDRRNIMDRCQGGKAFKEFSQPCGTMFSVKADGSDMVPISYHETTELKPSVDNNGMILYTRWDYIDRDFAAGHHLWMCYPDGRDPRAPHGNYALPHHTFDGKKWKDGRADRPWAEYSIKAIPGSRRYMAVAGKHHIAGPWGTLVLLNTAVEDDNKMSQVTLFHNYALPDEGKSNYHGDMDRGLPNSPEYADPWPLSEEFVITVNKNKVLLLDKFGNSELLFTADKNNCDGIDQIRSPIPLKAMKMPPDIPTMTHQGERYGKKDHKRATISIMNIYDSDFEWPEDTKIKWIRVLQLFPYPWHSPWQDQPQVGPGSGISTRAVLGVVPVEEDGSAYFEAPVEKAIYFQALDENGMAVQSMRSATYVHPGEQMTCLGCHEKRQETTPNRKMPMAIKRPPSKLVPNLEDGSCPLTYARLVQPLLKKCNSCHKKNGKPIPDLKKYQFFYHGTGADNGIKPIYGGYRTIAGRFGAIQSGLAGKMLMKHHRESLTMAEINRITLWADANSNELGAYYDVHKQRAGEVVWPLIDMDPLNPAGIDLMKGRPAPPYPDANTPLMKASEAQILKVKKAMDNDNKRRQNDLSEFASGWKLSNCDTDKDSGLHKEVAGRKNVFITHSLSKQIGCVISRQIDIAKDKKTVLKLEVGNHPKGNWALIVRINKEEVSRDVIGKKKGKTNWKTVITDLSKYAGTKVDVELVSQAIGRSNRAGYWSKIEVVNNQSVAAAKPKHEDNSIEQRADDSKWIDLFNGKNLDGWEGDPKIWSVKDGYIYASGPTSYKQYLINRSHVFKNFILEVKFIPVRGNSGVNYRCHDFKENDRPFEVSGYQCDIGPMGALYDIYTTSPSKRYGIIKTGFNELVDNKNWNTFRIVADGKNLSHYINGTLCFKFTDNDAKGFREKGFIAIEFHDKKVKAKFKDIRVKILEEIRE